MIRICRGKSPTNPFHFNIFFLKKVPEFLDTVLAKTGPKRLFSMIENEHFGLVCAKTGSRNPDNGKLWAANFNAHKYWELKENSSKKARLFFGRMAALSTADCLVNIFVLRPRFRIVGYAGVWHLIVAEKRTFVQLITLLNIIRQFVIIFSFFKATPSSSSYTYTS